MRDRWTGLGAALIIQACAGLTYTYAVYSEHLKEALEFSQEETDEVGAAKDLGYCFGILCGILYNYFPPWVTIVIGAVLHFMGYIVVWMTVTKRLRPLFWLLCTSIGIGVGGDSWLDTACMMTSLQNFKESRGTVVGLLKAQIGISGAIFVTIYKAYFKPDVDEYILMVATVPAVVSLVLAYCIRPLPPSPEDSPQAVKRRFLAAYRGIIVLALFLLVSIVIQALVRVDRAVVKFFAIFAVVILVSICYLVVSKNSLFLLAASQEDVTSKGTSLGVEGEAASHSLSEPSSSSPVGSGKCESSKEDIEQAEDTIAKSRAEEETAPLKGKFATEVAESFAVEHSTHLQERAPINNSASDFTLYDSVLQLNYWLLAFVMMTGPGSGLAVINNLSQMGQALMSKQVVLFVGLISIWSCFGRLGAGFGSDALVQAGYPRPLCLFIAHSTLAAGCLLLSLGHVSLLYFGSALVGLCYGSFWALVPTILSEVFGLTHFAAIYKTIVAFSPVGAFLLSAKLVGYLYDEEVEKYLGDDSREELGEHTCYGRACFASSLRLLALICVLGAGASVLLTVRTQRLYRQVEQPLR